MLYVVYCIINCILYIVYCIWYNIAVCVDNNNSALLSRLERPSLYIDKLSLILSPDFFLFRMLEHVIMTHLLLLLVTFCSLRKFTVTK